MLVRLGIATGCLDFLRHALIGGLELASGGFQVGRLYLKTQMVDTYFGPTLRDGKVDEGIVERPLGVIHLNARWLMPKRVE
jgi:hypothetical protein